MAILEYEDSESLGTVEVVDTSTVIVHVSNLDILRQLQVNRLVALHSSKPGQHLIGMVERITRKAAEVEETGDGEPPEEMNRVKIVLIGTLIDKIGEATNQFRRTLETVPEIGALCFPIEGERLTDLMRAISNVMGEASRLSLGNYTLDENAEALLDGNKFFQRHAVIVGSTGSGKSWTTAKVLEQMARLPNASGILFDVHGEYAPLTGKGFSHYAIAGPGDASKGRTLSDGVLYLPYWLLRYEDMASLLLDRSDQNAPNQAMLFSRAVVAGKKAYLEAHGMQDILSNFTIDSPVPYDLVNVLNDLEDLNSEMVQGSRGEKQGEFYGRLGRFIARLEAKKSDRRLSFMFGGPASVGEDAYLPQLAQTLMAGTHDQPEDRGGVKIIDFSEVPSDILPLVASAMARLVFSVQQWCAIDQRQPIAIVCDEAHLYIPAPEGGDSVSQASVGVFERIAKEGRKYGIGLVIISQRPSEVSRTVLSQCNNFIAMRLTNADDQAVIRRLLPDSLGGFGDLLPILDTGEALVVGDASLLPSRIRISEPDTKPSGATVQFWNLWSQEKHFVGIEQAVLALRKQSLD